jgi:hypothetical protein
LRTRHPFPESTGRIDRRHHDAEVGATAVDGFEPSVKRRADKLDFVLVVKERFRDQLRDVDVETGQLTVFVDKSEGRGTRRRCDANGSALLNFREKRRRLSIGGLRVHRKRSEREQRTSHEHTNGSEQGNASFGEKCVGDGFHPK